MSLSRIRALLNENKEFEDELTGASAKAQLKQERTYCNAFEITKSYDVNLTIIHPDNKIEKRTNVQINNFIDLIDKNAAQAELRYNFTILKASVNNINKHFTKPAYSSNTFQIAFDSLDNKAATKLAQLLTAFGTSAQVNMVAKKVELLPLLHKRKDGSDSKLSDYKKIFDFSVCIVERVKYQSVSLEELKTKVEALENDENSMEIKVILCDEINISIGTWTHPDWI